MLFSSLQICLPAINSSVLSPKTSDCQLLFTDLEGQIVNTHLKFLEVPFIKSRQIYIYIFRVQP